MLALRVVAKTPCTTNRTLRAIMANGLLYPSTRLAFPSTEVLWAKRWRDKENIICFVCARYWACYGSLVTWFMAHIDRY
jgi:hypothetical protein